jgi:hypothetical protein
MAKTYKNYSEFIETVFPEYYQEHQYKSESSLGDYIDSATETFKQQITRIIKGEDEKGNKA